MARQALANRAAFAASLFGLLPLLRNPTTAEVFATASGDCTVKVWDNRQPFSTLTLPAHEYEVLSCDWNKYNDCVLATGSVDKTIRTWVRTRAWRTHNARASESPVSTL